MASNRPPTKKFLAMVARVQLLGDRQIQVGIPKSNNDREDEGSEEGGMTNARLMALHEYGGTINVPAREGSITRYLRKDGSFAYRGKFRKSGNFQTFHAIPAHTITIPERSVFRYTFHKHNYFRNAAEKVAKKVAEGTVGIKQGADMLGVFARDEVRLAFTDGHLKPDSAETIRKKKSSKPLIDTGQLRQSITFVIKGKG